MFAVDWKIFAARFSGREERQFEQLALLHFCQSFNQAQGVFRFVDQPNLETNPVVVGSEVIGFQAKYYKDKISSHKQELIDAIIGAKKRYPTITKIRFYINLDHTDNPKSPDNKADYQKDIESAAHSDKIKVELEWFTKVNFEAALQCPDNSYITDYFFAPDVGLYDLMNLLDVRSQHAISEIRTSFDRLNGTEYAQADRSADIKWLSEAESGTISILYGQGGVGKSAVARLARERLYADSKAYYHLDSERFIKMLSLDSVVRDWHTTIDSFLKVHSGLSQKVLVVDSFEHIEGSAAVNDAIESISRFIKAGWIVICTVRTLYANSLKNKLEVYGDVAICRMREVCPLSVDFVRGALNACRIKHQSWASIIMMLCLPLYLNLFLRFGDDAENYVSPKAWRDALWYKIIKGDNPSSSSGDTFIKLVEQRLGANFTEYSRDYLSQDDIRSLMASGVLSEDPRTELLRITHDIYEEWALEKIIMRRFNKDRATFLSGLGSDLAVRRAFRQWLHDSIEDGSADDTFVMDILRADYSQWYDEIVVVMLHLKSLGDFLAKHTDELLANNSRIIARLVVWADVVGRVCKRGSPELGIRFKDSAPISFLMTEPDGEGWEALMGYCYDHSDVLPQDALLALIDIASSWDIGNRGVPIARIIARCAIAIAKRIDNGADIYLTRSYEKKLAKIISDSAKWVDVVVVEYIDDCLGTDNWRHLRFFGVYARLIVTHSFEHSNLITKSPRLAEKIFEGIIWKERHSYYNREWLQISDSDVYGLDSTLNHTFGNRSAFQTPTLLLLLNGEAKAVEFIVNLLNRFFENYVVANRRQAEKQVFILDDNTSVSLYSGVDIWSAHRGTVGPMPPNLIVCVLMALEKYLLMIAERSSEDLVEKLCLALLKKSNSVAIAGVLSSVVIKYHRDRRFKKLALALFSCRAAFNYDSIRWAAESLDRVRFAMIGNDPMNHVLEQERKDSDEQPFRKESLEFAACNCQLIRNDHQEEDLEFANQIWCMLDNYYRQFESLSPEDQCFKSRVDMRDVERWEKIEGVGFKPISKVGPDVEKFQIERQAAHKPTNLSAGLMTWSLHLIDSRYADSGETPMMKVYNEHPEQAVRDLDELINEYYNKTDNVVVDSAIPQACAALLQCHSDILTNEQRDKYLEILMRGLRSAFSEEMSPLRHIRDVLLGSFVLLVEKIEGEYAATFRLSLLTILLSDVPCGLFGTRDAFSVISNAAVTNQFRHDLMVDYVFVRNICIQEGVWRDGSDKIQAIVKFFEHRIDIVCYLSDMTLRRKWEEISGDTSTETKVFALSMLNVQDMLDEDENFLADNLKNVLMLLYTPKPDGDVFSSRYSSVRQNFLRKISPWLLSLSGDRLTFVISQIVSVPHILEVPDILDELAIYAETVGPVGAFSSYWEAFSPYIGHDNSVIASYLLVAMYWNINGEARARPGQIVDDKLIAVIKSVFQRLAKRDGVVDMFAIFFSGMGINYALDGLNWIAQFLPVEFPRQNTISAIDNLLYVTFDRYKGSVLSDMTLRTSLLKILDFQVANRSTMAFQIRESL